MEIKNNIFVNKEIIDKQKDITLKIFEREDKPKKYHIITFGCQMNVNDSQKLAYMLDNMGIEECKDKESADLVIFNTCCVRENAERRALGNIMWLKELKKTKPNLIIAVCGCMVQQKSMLDTILKQYKFIDIVFGTHNLHMFPELLYNYLDNKKKILAINDEHVIAEGLGSKRDIPHHAFVSIMYGCNNFCTFCIVPYVRGRERSRKIDDILFDVDNLLKSGVQEIMLLGQNVNSYGKGNEDGINFPKLLKILDSEGVPRIRFMTSHPKDLSDELIEVIANSSHIAKHIHLPVQSGSSKILKAMNRIYNRDEYISLVEKIRKNIDGVGLTTDIIVGFPGETEEDFQETLSLAETIKYDSAFTFVYSKRIGTKAANMPNLPEKSISMERLQRLNKIIVKYSHQVLHEQVGNNEVVLIDGLSEKNPSYVYGRTSRNIKVFMDGTKEDIGKFYKININNIVNNTLYAKKLF